MLSAGLESKIQIAGTVSKAQPRWRQQPARLHGMGRRSADTNQCTGWWHLGQKYGNLILFPGHCQHQCSVQKTRELGKLEKNKINEHSRWWEMAMLFPCKTLFTIWTQAGLKPAMGLWGNGFLLAARIGGKLRKSFPASPSPGAASS